MIVSGKHGGLRASSEVMTPRLMCVFVFIPCAAIAHFILLCPTFVGPIRLSAQSTKQLRSQTPPRSAN
jgi:hypothetical protein